MPQNSIAHEMQTLQSLKSQETIALDTLLQAHELLRNLRAQYKKTPASFTPSQLAELKACAEWITVSAAQRSVELVRQEQLAHAEIARQETRKEALRELIGQAMRFDHVGQMDVDGIQVIMKESEVLALPASGTKDRAALETLLRTQGAWESVSALSVPRLNQYRLGAMNVELRQQLEAQYGLQNKQTLVIKKVGQAVVERA